LVRPGIRTPGSLVPIALIGVLHATHFYSNAIAVRAALAGLCEAGLIGFTIIQVRRKTRRMCNGNENADPLDAIGTALASVLSVPAVVKQIAAELGILYYALFSWRARPHVASGTRAFSIYQRAGQTDILAVAAIACVLEAAPMHLLLRHW